MRRIFDKTVKLLAKSPGQPVFVGAIAISLLLHGVVAVALVDDLAELLPETEESPIFVKLVPPPEPEEPEPELSAQETPPQPQENPQTEEELAALSSPVRDIRPVSEFGETDTAPPADPDEVSKQEPEQPISDTDSLEESPVADTAPSEVIQDEAVETADEQGTDAPKITEHSIEVEQNADAETASDNPDIAGPVSAPDEPAPEPVQDPVTERDEAESPGEMIAVKQLFTDAIVNDPNFKTAMADLPRTLRAETLCTTEIRDQLRAAQRQPEFVPKPTVLAGTVMELKQVAFYSRGQWFDLAFRCEVDEAVTRVLKFSYRVGDVIPPEEWPQRDIPSN